MLLQTILTQTFRENAFKYVLKELLDA